MIRPGVWKNNFQRLIQRNLRWKIFLAIALVVLISMFVVGAITFHYSLMTDQKNWQTRQEEVTLYAASLMETHFKNIFQYLDQISSFPLKQELIDSSYLFSILENSPYFYEILILKQDGEIVAAAWIDSPMLTNSFTIPQSNWFLQAKEGFRYIGDLQISSDNHSYLIIAQPTSSDEILVVRLQAAFFQSIIRNIRFGVSGKITIFNEWGDIIAHTDYENVLAKKTVPDIAFNENAENSYALYYGESTGFSGNKVMISAKRMVENNWVVVTAIEKAEIGQASRTQLKVYLIGFFIFGSLVVFVILLMLNKNLFSPLKKLKEGTNYIAEGAYYHQIPVDGEDEIGQVAQSFNHMTQRIRQRDKSLVEEIKSRERITKALEISQERYALAAKGSNDGIWDWHLVDNQVHYSQRWKSLLGYEDAEIGTSPQEWLDRIHHEDSEIVLYHLNQHLEGKTPFFRCEFRIQTKQENYIWVSYRALMEVDQEGKPYRIAGSQSDITAQKEFEEKLHTAAYHDSLTGLPNRHFLNEKLKQILQISLNESAPAFAVMFLDLDRFKLINDSFGHMKGDQLLLSIASMLRDWIKPGDFISRFGGDEFILVMQKILGPEQVIGEIQLLHERFNKPFEIDGKQVYVGVSVGVAIGPDHYHSPDEIIRDADIALYQAKSLGLSHYVIFDPVMRRLAVDSLSIEIDLRQALEKNQFVLHYQPVINLESMALSGFEALIRWQHPEQGLIVPFEFISVAEQSNLINGIGKWVLDESMRQLSEWQRKNPSLTMSINLSAKQLSDGSLIDSICVGLAIYQIDPAKFALEITETSVLEFDEDTIQKLFEIKNTGVRLYLDDFGTGYSSLNVLHKYPIDVIKIDQTFIREILNDRNKIEIAHTIVQLGFSLGLDVIAEGIENAEALQLLREFHCPYGQGYYFSKPVPAELIDNLLAEGTNPWQSTKPVK
jgi:diguanylate cyclase (GGDEF)-like protein/PAS domain S-box-containing protein